MLLPPVSVCPAPVVIGRPRQRAGGTFFWGAIDLAKLPNQAPQTPPRGTPRWRPPAEFTAELRKWELTAAGPQVAPESQGPLELQPEGG